MIATKFNMEVDPVGQNFDSSNGTSCSSKNTGSMPSQTTSKVVAHKKPKRLTWPLRLYIINASAMLNICGQPKLHEFVPRQSFHDRMNSHFARVGQALNYGLSVVDSEVNNGSAAQRHTKYTKG